ncbi:M66 family metalloprotease [Enhygromyxa salina]|uniref:Uncharacterized protein n=1 Tax=Enhygromyxa salina TaxID=215803 RepID=A0A2S9YLM2_9BACT|nr:M66 family metalloprotease [Enhygromyxa salina]PRQ05984.1 hypothetical protein ENSA7_42460 [Enhygromyxa salina]
MRRGTIVWLGLALLCACGDDVTVDGGTLEAGLSGETNADPGDGDPGDGDPGDGDPGDGDGDPGDGDGDPGDGDGDPGDGDGDPGPPFVPFAQADWARGGIAIDRVEVNQAVAIEVVSGGQLIPVEQRTGGLVKDRNTLIQVFWTIPGGWQPRPIKAKLHIRNTQNQLELVELTKTISGAPSAGSIDGPITFALPAEQFGGDLEFFIELWEGEGGHDNLAASSASPSAPAGGMQPIGVTTEPMEAKVVLVPVQYDYGNCHTNTNNIINTNFQNFQDWFFAQNPIHTLNMTIHPETLVLDTQLTTLSQINSRLAALRFTDFAEPNEYYHAIVNSCSGGVDGAGGLAPGTPGPYKGSGDLRVSTSLWVDAGWTRDTIVHELGHNQGRPHSPCGNPDGPDENYPHAGSSIGAWGFNVVSFAWYSPSTRKDYMSYCSPAWVSDWTWGFVHEQVRQLTSWDYSGAGAGSDDQFVEVLHGWVHPSGLEQWWTSPGELPDEMLTASDYVGFYADDGELIDQLPAASWLLDDGKTRYFMAEVPDSDLPLVDQIVRISNDVATVVPRGQITRRFDN